ncbi:MAG TPA: ATP-binding protein [Leifsonia sp.]|jgi:signal transduction histidine kinase|nr:ATP-binding protein [Leifsonia sp.]
MTDQSPRIDLPAIVERVYTRLYERLDEANNVLVSDKTIAKQLHRQVEGILRQTFDRLGVPTTQGSARAPEGIAVGELRARQNIHPVDSLTAATLLFEVALDEIAAEDLDAGRFSRALNASIMANVIPASVSYVNVLLERLAVAHSEERLGISRELHDRVAHGIATGIQRLQLGQQNTSEQERRSSEALTLLESALDETRAIALDLRHSVGDKTLDQAIRDYVTDLDQSGPRVEVRTSHEPYQLSTGVQEEAFIIVREAIRNARRHSHAPCILLAIDWQPTLVALTVSDLGVGFRHDAIRSGALGLIAAQERAELIGAELTIDTEPGKGTTVTLTIARIEGAL